MELTVRGAVYSVVVVSGVLVTAWLIWHSSMWGAVHAALLIDMYRIVDCVDGDALRHNGTSRRASNISRCALKGYYGRRRSRCWSGKASADDGDFATHEALE